jgi:hypothetical protein
LMVVGKQLEENDYICNATYHLCLE